MNLEPTNDGYPLDPTRISLTAITYKISESFGHGEGRPSDVIWRDHRLEPEFKRRWVAALRSGQYHPVNGVLALGNVRKDGRKAMCCLGVGIDCDPNQQWEGQFKASDIGENRLVKFVYDKPGDTASGTHYSMPPSRIEKSWHLDSNMTSGLATANDFWGAQLGQEWFTWLAYWIELNL